MRNPTRTAWWVLPLSLLTFTNCLSYRYFPDWDEQGAFNQMMVRELPPLPRHTLAFAQPSIGAEVESIGTPRWGTQTETSLALTLPIGPGQPIQCTLYFNRLDAAAEISRIESAWKRSVQLISLTPTHVAVAGEMPLLFVNMIYRSDHRSADSEQLGHLNIMVSSSEGRSLTCLLNELGYLQTFRRITQGLATSLRVASNEPASEFDFSTIEVLKLNSAAVGYIQTDAVREGDNLIFHSYASAVFPATENHLATRDRALTEWSDAQGELTEMEYTEKEEDNIILQGNLHRDAERRYSVQGTSRGKVFENVLPAGRSVWGFPHEREQIKEKLLNGSETSLSFEVFAPFSSTQQLLDVSLTRDRKNFHRLRYRALDFRLDIEVDDDAIPLRTESVLPRGKFTTERLFPRPGG